MPELGNTAYRFNKLQQTRVKCEDSTSTVYEDGVYNVTLDPGCQLDTADVRITHLAEETVVQRAQILEEIDFEAEDDVNYEAFLQTIAHLETHPVYTRVSLWTNHILTIVLCIVLFLAFAYILYERRQFKKHEKEKKERRRMKLELASSPNIDVTVNTGRAGGQQDQDSAV